MRKIRHNHYTAQLLTGHGNIKSTLHRLKLSDTDLCRCGQKDTVEHIIYNCKEEQAERKKMVEEIATLGTPWPCTLAELSRTTTIVHLTRFAEMVLKKENSQGSKARKHVRKQERRDNTVEAAQAQSKDCECTR
ncbi:hypothetical protein K0M31_002291 [Melipona bicolor]|uniref:Uncharacterized protein n=1 Tax=Melipona bicolor TaxID=60889 RepID=A0AA40GHH3_9HYME|nr:hypothetical protein K0M31_002291 [Melipona bicolor]